MPSAILAEAGTFRVLVMDLPHVWWEVVPDARVVAEVADPASAQRVARLLEGVEDATAALVVNGAARADVLRDVAAGRAPLTLLEAAHELVDLDTPRDLAAGEPYPFRVGDLDDAAFPVPVRALLAAEVRRLVGRVLDQAQQPQSRLAVLRAAGETLLARAAGVPLDADSRPVFRVALSESTLECVRCLCDFDVVAVPPDAPPDPYALPAAVTVEWRDTGVRLAESLDEVDDCPCHGEPVTFLWAGARAADDV